MSDEPTTPPSGAQAFNTSRSFHVDRSRPGLVILRFVDGAVITSEGLFAIFHLHALAAQPSTRAFVLHIPEDAVLHGEPFTRDFAKGLMGTDVLVAISCPGSYNEALVRMMLAWDPPSHPVPIYPTVDAAVAWVETEARR